MSRPGDGPASGSARWTPTSNGSPPTARWLAVGLGTVLVGSYLSVFYHIVDVVGGARWLAVGVGLAVVLATVWARLASVRSGVVLGVLLVVAGVLAYLTVVPSIHDDLLTRTFVVRWLGYLTGVSVLDFLRVDVWAIVLAPGVVFLSWTLLVARRYAGSALVGGLMLGFFTLTGDAGTTTTLVGMTSLLGLLGAGTLEASSGSVAASAPTLREVTQLGIVVAVAVLVTRWFRVVPRAGAFADGSGSAAGDAQNGVVSGDLNSASERANIAESISLSATVLFTIEADAPDYWQVAAYDRYTGRDWVRTGGTGPYEGGLDPPPGRTDRNEQTVTVHRRVRTLPAAWRPVAVEGIDPARVRVTDLGGLAPASTLDRADRYRVRSETVVDAGATVVVDKRRGTGNDYPDPIRRRYLQVPESTPDRVRQLAERVAGDAGTADEAASAVSRWLAANKAYDVTVDRPPGDVVDAFLFSMDRGYCVYFASAMVVMLRTLGLPARFVLGYETGQSVGGGQWVVRGLDSHAWVQVYIPLVGWTRYDPTPDGPRRALRRRTLARARARDESGVDANGSRPTATPRTPDLTTSNGTAGNASNATGAGSTPGSLPTPVGGSLGRAGGSPADGSGRGPSGAVGSWLADRDRLDLLVGAVGVTFGLHWVGAFEAGYRAVRLRWQRPTDSPRRDVARAYERLELLLARRFRPRDPEETRRRYVERASVVVDEDPARRILDLYERATYAGTVSRMEADEAIRLVDALVAGTG